MNEEEPLLAAKYAVSMHKYANRRSGIWGQIILVVVIASALYFKSFWPLAVGFLAYIAIHIYLMFSCVKFVTQKTGMSSDEQAYYSRLYKSNSAPEFTSSVDEHYKDLLNSMEYLKAAIKRN
jgi:hypothetical protein